MQYASADSMYGITKMDTLLSGTLKQNRESLFSGNTKMEKVGILAAVAIITIIGITFLVHGALTGLFYYNAAGSVQYDPASTCENVGCSLIGVIHGSGSHFYGPALAQCNCAGEIVEMPMVQTNYGN